MTRFARARAVHHPDLGLVYAPRWHARPLTGFTAARSFRLLLILMVVGAGAFGAACGTDEQAVSGGKPLADCDYARRVQAAGEAFAVAITTAAASGNASGAAAGPVYDALTADMAKIEEELASSRLGPELDVLNQALTAFFPTVRTQAGVMKRAAAEGDRTPVSVMLEKWQNEYVDHTDRLSREHAAALSRLDKCEQK
jgi:hypothetical protein